MLADLTARTFLDLFGDEARERLERPGAVEKDDCIFPPQELLRTRSTAVTTAQRVHVGDHPAIQRDGHAP